MTTILADTKLRVMVADSNFSDGDLRGPMRKVWRVRGGMVGLAGNLEMMAPFILWIREGMPEPAPRLREFSALWLSDQGLLWFANSAMPIVVQGRCHAIGTGATAAMAAHEALDFTDARRAVLIACKHDSGSRPPVRQYRLKE